jgi:hypothetical protein
MSAKSTASGFQGQKVNTGRDAGAGSGAPSKAGTGYLEKSRSSSDGDRSKRPAPKESGHSAGIKKGGSAGGDASRLKGDGVGGPLPSA